MTNHVAAVAGVVSLVGLSGVIGSLLYLHLVPTGLSPITNAVSQYGITRYRAGYRVATISFGCAGIALAVGLHAALTTPGVFAVVTSLGVFAIGRLVISWFPMDAPGSTRTSTGHAHGLIAIVTFTSAAVAAFRLGSVLTAGPLWQPLAPVSTGLGIAMVACIVAMFLGRTNLSVRCAFGAVERSLYVAIIGWFIVMSVACVTSSR